MKDSAANMSVKVCNPGNGDLNPSLKLFLIWIMLSVVFIVPSILKYWSLHTHFWDMGIYQHFLWNYSFTNMPDSLVFANHFRPILFILAAVYKLFPYGESLLILQSMSLSITLFPLYALSRDMLGKKESYLVVFLYCFFSPIWFINLSDFHPDSFMVPLAVFSIYFLKRNKMILFMVSIIFLVAIKEIAIFIAAFIGLYAALKYKRTVFGGILFLAMIISGIFIVDKLIPAYSGQTPLEVTGVSWLADGMVSLAKNILLNPLSILSTPVNYWKAIYIIILFGSFLFIPFLAPLELLPAIPGISLALLSELWRQYALVYHYPSTVVPFIFIAFIEGLRKSGGLKSNVKKFMVTVFMIINVSYLSLFLFYKNDSYHYSRYIVTDRDTVIRKAIETYVPDDIAVSVSSSNLVNHAHLAHRKNYLNYPKGTSRVTGDKIHMADYIVLDLTRIRELRDMMINREANSSRSPDKKYKEIETAVSMILKDYEKVFDYDNFYILTKKNKK
jgi:uncharacterized membrane protein